MREALSYALPSEEAQSDLAPDMVIAPLPRISIQAFCETQALVAAIEEAANDRRMARTHLKVQMGGAAAALEAYQSAPTPNSASARKRW